MLAKIMKKIHIQSFFFVIFATEMKLQRLFTILIAVFITSAAMADRPKIGLVLGGGGAKGAAEVVR